MNSGTANRVAPTAAQRRVRFGAMTAVLLIAATVSVVVANLLASRYDARIDVTATGEHRLSPRSVSLLSRLEGKYEVVIAAPLRDPSIVDRRALEPLRDVLDEFDHAGGKVSTTMIDTGSTAGLQEYDVLLKRIADRDADKVKTQTDFLSKALDQAEQGAAAIDGFAPSLQAVKDAIPEDSPGGPTNRSYFDQRRVELTTTAQTLRDTVGKSRAVLSSPTGQLPIPDLDRAATPVIQLLHELEGGLNDISENSRRFSLAESVPQAARDAAKPVTATAAALRDRIGVLRDEMERMPRLDILRVARTLQAGAAALIIGPPASGVTAIDLGRLLPPPSQIDAEGGARADLGRNAEELIATALASLAQPVKPIVMFVHAEPGRGLLQSASISRLLDRLSLRGMDAAEWAVALDTEPPPLTRADPTGKRPVVYVFVSTDASFSPATKGQSGPERAAKLGKALAGLLDAGKPVLLSLDPSTLPTFGEADPMVAPLGAFGLAPQTGTPLLKERFAADGRHVDATQTLVALDVNNPIAKAVRGLPLRLEWPIAIRTSNVADVIATPLYVVDDPTVWGESQWLSYWQVPIAQHDSVPSKPAKDSQRDDSKGPWPVVVAAERHNTGGTQRLLVVGSDTWFTDRIAQDRAMVDGRAVLTSPGNSELFEASVYWLAGQDDMIAQSPTARAVPLIRPLAGGTLLLLRWAAILGLPGAVLLLGLVLRLVRG